VGSSFRVYNSTRTPVPLADSSQCSWRLYSLLTVLLLFLIRTIPSPLLPQHSTTAKVYARLVSSGLVLFFLSPPLFTPFFRLLEQYYIQAAVLTLNCCLVSFWEHSTVRSSFGVVCLYSLVRFKCYGTPFSIASTVFSFLPAVGTLLQRSPFSLSAAVSV
jgi:hypothetical protein